MNRRRYQLSIRQMMLLILLGTVWVQLAISWRKYTEQAFSYDQKLPSGSMYVELSRESSD